MSTPTEHEHEDHTSHDDGAVLSAGMDSDVAGVSQEYEITDAKADDPSTVSPFKESIKLKVDAINDTIAEWNGLGCKDDYQAVLTQLAAMRDMTTTLNLGSQNLTQFTEEAAGIKEALETLKANIDVKGKVDLGNAYARIDEALAEVVELSQAVTSFKLSITASAQSTYPTDLVEICNLFDQAKADTQKIASALTTFTTCPANAPAEHKMDETRKAEIADVVDNLKQVQNAVDNADDLVDEHFIHLKENIDYFSDAHNTFRGFRTSLNSWSAQLNGDWTGAAQANEVKSESDLDAAGGTTLEYDEDGKVVDPGVEDLPRDDEGPYPETAYTQLLTLIGGYAGSSDALTSGLVASNYNSLTDVSGALSAYNAAYLGYIASHESKFTEPATKSEVQSMIDAVNYAKATAELLARIGTDGGSGANDETAGLTAADYNSLPEVSNALEANDEEYLAYIAQTTFTNPATISEVQQMIVTVNGTNPSNL